jgi:hypothetical protein
MCLLYVVQSCRTLTSLRILGWVEDFQPFKLFWGLDMTGVIPLQREAQQRKLWS